MSKRWRQMAGLGVSAGVLLLAGFGCKGLSSEEQAAVRPVSLEYWTVVSDVDQLRAQIATYRAARPYLTVTVKQLRADEIYPRLVEALSEDRGPDIISVNNRLLGKYESKLAALPPAVNDATVIVEKTQLGGTNTIINRQTRPTVDVVQLGKEYVQAVADDVVRNGKIYGLPLSVDTLALYYNKDILDRAGLAEPPETWDEFEEAVKKITKYDRNGEVILSGAALGTGANVPGSDDIVYSFLRQSKIPFTDSSGRAVFNRPPTNVSRSEPTPAMTVLDFYTNFANPGSDTYSWHEGKDNALDAFVNGTVAFFFGYSYHYPLIKSRAPQLNFDVLPLLQLYPDTPVNAANYWVEAVTAKSKNQNEAWGLLMYLTHSGASKDYLTATGRPTALRAYIGLQKDDPALAPFISQLLVSANWYRGLDYEPARKAIQDLVHEWLLPPPDPNRALEWKQQALDRAAAKINQTL